MIAPVINNPAQGCKTYVVKNGDNCNKISALYKIGNDFWSLNPTIDRSCLSLRIGQIGESFSKMIKIIEISDSIFFSSVCRRNEWTGDFPSG